MLYKRTKMASDKFSPQAPACIEMKSIPIPHQKMEGTVTIDRRCYVNRKKDAVEKRIRISIFKKTSYAVELNLDDAIAFFKQGIELAEKTKNYSPYR